MTYLGVDQSLRSPGFSVVNTEGQVLHVENLTTGPLRGIERLAVIRNRLLEVIYKFKPSFSALEGYSIQSINRPFDLGEVGGIVRLTLFDQKVNFIVVPPTQLKKFVRGNGQASKERVIRSVKKKWYPKADNAQDDQADAIGLAQVARVYCTGLSTFRSELEVIKTIKEDKPLKEKVLRRKGVVNV